MIDFVAEEGRERLVEGGVEIGEIAALPAVGLQRNLLPGIAKRGERFRRRASFSHRIKRVELEGKAHVV